MVITGSHLAACARSEVFAYLIHELRLTMYPLTDHSTPQFNNRSLRLKNMTPPHCHCALRQKCFIRLEKYGIHRLKHKRTDYQRNTESKGFPSYRTSDLFRFRYLSHMTSCI